jgi:hypothetical protein
MFSELFARFIPRSSPYKLSVRGLVGRYSSRKKKLTVAHNVLCPMGINVGRVSYGMYCIYNNMHTLAWNIWRNYFVKFTVSVKPTYFLKKKWF